MKRRGDFTTPGDDEAAIERSRAQGAPVDSFLSTNEQAEAGEAARAMKAAPVQEGGPTSSSSGSPQQQQQAVKREQVRRAEEMYFGQEGELAFARNIEVTNGRRVIQFV